MKTLEKLKCRRCECAKKRNAQTSLFDPQVVDHPVADDLERASAWLDAHPELLAEIAADLGARSGSSRGRRGLSCETVLRCALLKHLRRETYRGLEFALRDSLSARRFARVEASRLPGKSALQATIGAIRAETWERINRCLLGAARDEKVELGDQVRVDSTVTHTHILEPSDSQLLRDGVRVLTRLLVAARKELGAEKVVSLFEPHTDIIRKGGRKTHYGHKVNFATGRSGLVLDAVVEDGNPADSARCLPMLQRHVEHYGAAPSRAAFDGGYASRGNLKAAKDLGVAHVVFNKKRGIKVADMTPSSWLYARLKRFRAGIEAGISYLKRCFGLGLCRWRGLPLFNAYVQSAVFAHNLLRIVRLLPRPT